MTEIETSERYLVPVEVLREYEKWDLYGGAKKIAGEWQFDEEDLERLGVIMTLHNIGFENREVEQYMRLELHGDVKGAERIRMLQQKRDQVLDEIHIQEKRIDDLDYLRYGIQPRRNEMS